MAVDLIAHGCRVNGSTTSTEKLSSLERKGIVPFQITLLPAPEGPGVKEFFSSDILIISIPPGRKSGSTAQYLERMKALSQYVSTSTIRKVIFISSTSIYPDNAKEMKEDDAQQDSYLNVAEQYFMGSDSIQTTVLRLGGLVGPDRHPGRFLSGKTGVAGANHPVNVIHQSDCVRIIRTVIQKNVWNIVMNACCDVHLSRKDFYVAAASALHLPLPEFLPDSSNGKIVNSDKLKLALDFTFSNELVLDMQRS